MARIVLIYIYFPFDNYRFQLLKLVQKCGAIEKFDMLFHKGGPMVGQSRGYAFVTFAQNEGATNALTKLEGTNVGSRSIVVRLAKNIKYVSTSMFPQLNGESLNNRHAYFIRRMICKGRSLELRYPHWVAADVKRR